MTLVAGTWLGPYEIVAPLDAGGMGEVYRAKDPRIGREVAIKILPASWSADRDRLRRFAQEARAAGGLNHPALLTIYDVGEQDGVPYLVSELLEGETLRTRLRGGPLSPRRAIDYAIQIVRGLAAAHEKGIVHRDIKPENIFITTDGRVKILDFGLAKVVAGDASASAATLGATEPGQVMGTAAYMSPEQVRGDTVDARSDIFSFGALLYEMLTGSHAFDGPSRVETMNAILTADAREVTNAAPALGRIVGKCLEKHPQARFQSSADLAFHLEQVSDISGALASTVKSRQRTRFLLAAALVIAIVIAGVLLRNSMRHARSDSTGTPIQSLAVLPFENATGRKDLEYVSDGFSEELIDKLSELSGVRIIARTTAFSFKNKPVDLRKIAQDLDVDAVVVGKLTMQGDSKVLKADLIDVKTGAELWGGRYEDVTGGQFRVQDRLAESIGRRLGAHWINEPVRNASTHSQPAYDEYLRGRYDWNRRSYASLQSAAGHFRNAIGLDPDFALAYTGLADTYGILIANLSPANRNEIMQTAEEAAQKALALAPDLAEAHASRGLLEQNRWNVRVAQDEFNRAIALNPNLASAHHWMSLNYRTHGDYPNALREIQAARRLDPLSPLLWTVGSFEQFDAGNDEAAAAEAAESLAIAPDFTGAALTSGVVAMERHDFKQAENLFRRATERPFVAYGGEAALANLYGRTGRMDAAMAIIERLKHPGPKEHVSPLMVCYALAGVGKNREAVDWFERGIAEKDGITLTFFRSRMLGDLRNDARYQAVVRRLDAQLWQ